MSIKIFLRFFVEMLGIIALMGVLLGIVAGVDSAHNPPAWVIYVAASLVMILCFYMIHKIDKRSKRREAKHVTISSGKDNQ